jgi:predicted nucleic acid-binding protein
MRVLWEEASRVATTRLTLVEARSAVARAARGGRLSAAGLRRVRTELRFFLEQLSYVEAEASILRVAADLAEKHVLRAYDAVHLASVLALGDSKIAVATWDPDLRSAVRSEGLALVR